MPHEPIDFWGDHNHKQLYEIEHLYGVPEFVKRATTESLSELKAIPSESFADPIHRRFPCHTKAATWLANAYFQMARNSYSKDQAAVIQDRIVKSASFFGITGLTGNFNTTFTKMATADMDTLPNEAFALVVQTDDGQTIRRMPMPNVLSVKYAGEFLYANRFKYPYQWRKTAARKILQKAMEYDELAEKGVKIAGAVLGATQFGIETQRFLNKAAGFGTVHPRRAAEKVAQRAMMLGKNSPFTEKLASIAVTLRDAQSIKPAQYQKLAAIIDSIDRETGICDHYAEGVDMPEEMFFDILEKDAEAFMDNFVTLTTGNTFPVGAFSTLSLDKIAEVLGVEFSDAVSQDGQLDLQKFAEVAHTLPRSDAQLLERIMQEDVEGAIKEARAPRMSRETFTKEDLTARLKKEGKKIETVDYVLQYKA